MHPIPMTDQNLFLRIQDNFLASKQSINPNDIGNHWNRYFNRKKSSKFFDPHYLENFRAPSMHRLSDGCDDQASWQKTVSRLFILLRSQPLHTLNLLSEARIGRPPCVKIDGHCYNHHDLSLVYYALQIQPHIENTANPVFCEIGSGFGGLAHKLKILLPAAKIILIDLPEAAAITTYYLASLNPHLKLLTYLDFRKTPNKEGEFNDLFQSDFDFAVLPPEMLAEMPARFCDAFINTCSMMEMKFATIQHYFAQIHEKTRHGGIFYNVNRYAKDTVGECIRLRDYPYDKQWEVIGSHPSLLQSHIHELITKRTGTGSDSITRILHTLPDKAYLQRYEGIPHDQAAKPGDQPLQAQVDPIGGKLPEDLLPVLLKKSGMEKLILWLSKYLMTMDIPAITIKEYRIADLSKGRFLCTKMPSAVAYAEQDGFRISKGTAGHIAHGPYVRIRQNGSYVAGLTYMTRKDAAGSPGVFEIVAIQTDAFGQKLAIYSFLGQAILENTGGALQTKEIAFDTSGHLDDLLEFRVYASADATLCISGIVTQPESRNLTVQANRSCSLL